jgi:hypothetical protein
VRDGEKSGEGQEEAAGGWVKVLECVYGQYRAFKGRQTVHQLLVLLDFEGSRTAVVSLWEGGRKAVRTLSSLNFAFLGGMVAGLRCRTRRRERRRRGSAKVAAARASCGWGGVC